MDYDEQVYKIFSHVVLMAVSEDDKDLLKNYNYAIFILGELKYKVEEAIKSAKNPEQPH